MVMARGLGEASRCRASQLGLPRAAFERAYLSLRTKSHESGAALTSYSASRIESGIIVPPSCHVAVAELTGDEAMLQTCARPHQGGCVRAGGARMAFQADQTTA